MVGVASDVVERAQKKGATVAECVVHDSAHLSAKVHLGQPSWWKKRAHARSVCA